MMKKIVICAAVITLCAVICFNVFSYTPVKPLVNDEAHLLSDTELGQLESRLEELSGRCGMDIVIVTTNSWDGKTANEFADDYFDYNLFGGRNGGMTLAINMTEREWATSGSGPAQFFIDDWDLYDIEDNVVGYLKIGDYFNAFSVFGTMCSEYAEEYEYGDETFEEFVPGEIYDPGIPYEPYDPYDPYDDTRSLNANFFSFVPVCAIIGLIFSLIKVNLDKKKLTSVKPVNNALNYFVEGSFDLSESSDQFLYQNVSKVMISDDSDNGRSGGGGGHSYSSVHHSSSGSSHSGHSGHF